MSHYARVTFLGIAIVIGTLAVRGSAQEAGSASRGNNTVASHSISDHDNRIAAAERGSSTGVVDNTKQPGSVSGTVRVHGTGEPAAGVSVKTVSKWFDPVLTHTNDNGSYTLKGIRPDAIFFVTAEDEERGLYTVNAGMRAVVLEPGESRQGVDLVVYAGRTGSVSGRVMGRRVSYRKPKQLTINITKQDLERREETPLPNVKVVLRKGEEMLAETRTDETGRYIFERLRAGRYTVGAEPPVGTVAETVRTLPMSGRGPAEDHGSSQFHRVKLEGEAQTDVGFHFRQDVVSIAGRVSDRNGNPVAGAEVTGELCTRTVDGGTARSGAFTTIKISRGSAETTSGADGRYRLDDLCPVSFTEIAVLLASARTYCRYEVRVEAEGYAPAAVLVSPATERLVDQAKRLMADFPGLYDRNPNQEEDGAGIGDLAGVVLPESRENTIMDVDVMLARAATVAGHVVDSEGNVVSHGGIRMVPADFSEDLEDLPSVDDHDPMACWTRIDAPVAPIPPGATAWVRLDREGRFRFEGVPAGRYLFEVATGQSRKRARNELLVLRPGDRKEVEVVAAPPGN